MIKSVELKNIQSHENTRLEFDKGINVIVGSSNSGKSAILRGLFWVRYNRPLGVDTLASHWALTDKGDLKKEMSVTVENDSGTVERRRAKGDNQYIVNGKVLDVVKSDVPVDVEAVLALSDTNIQKQLDEPFLLSKTSGEVARYFNRVVRLDIIDTVLGKAESSKRKIQSDIKSAESQVADCKEKLEGFGWLEEAGKLIGKYQRASERNSELKKAVGVLSESLVEYQQYSEKIIDLDKQKKLADVIERQMRMATDLAGDVSRLFESIRQFESVKVYPDFAEQKKLVLKIEKWDEHRLLADVTALKASVVQYGIQMTHVENSEKEIACLKEQLPAVCPLCGSPLKDGCCEKN